MGKGMFGNVSFLNVVTPIFMDEIERQHALCAQVDWKPTAGGDIRVMEAVDEITENPLVRKANKTAVDKIKAAQPVLTDIGLAADVIPGMTETTILHAGPPIEYERMCGPMKGAVIGALLYEGLAPDQQAAQRLAESGEITFAPCHHYGAVGPMAGIISASMPVHVVTNKTDGNQSYATVNEGLGKVLRYGANSPEVIDRLCYIKDEFAPVMQKVIQKSGGIDLKNLTAQGLHMGDECHNRNKAVTSLLIKTLLPYFLEDDMDQARVKKALEFLCGNDHYYLNLSMAACKCCLDAAQGVKHSTIVTAMSRNGVDFGIRVAGFDKNRWFTGPAQYVQGLFFPGFQEGDASPDIGDSAITETMGIGGFAMAAAPSIVQFVGGCVADAVNYSRQMYYITETENPAFSLPPLDFRGSALGIDIVKVVATGILPIINTGMAHKHAGVGQVGAGLVSPPMECFTSAVLEFAKYNC